MIDLSELKNAGVTIKKFCSLDVKENISCTGEAVGEVVAQMEDGMTIPLPVCQIHLDMIQAEFAVEQLS